MKEEKVCGICFLKGVKTFDVKEFSFLRSYYEDLIGKQAKFVIESMSHFCYECATLLHKFQLFRNRCLRGLVLLEKLLVSDLNITKFAVSIDRDKENLESPLKFWEVTPRVGIFNYNHDNICNDYKSNKLDVDPIKTEISSDSETDGLKVEPEEAEFTDVSASSDDPEYEIPIKINKKVKKDKGEIKLKYMQQRNRAKKRNENHWKIIVLTEEEQQVEFSKRKELPFYQKSVYKCDMCYKGFRTERKKLNHMRLHDAVRGNMQCKFCKMRFPWPGKLRAHMKIHSVRAHCLRCQHVSDGLRINEHDKSHENMLYQCKHCDMKFHKATTYLSHVRVKHRSEHICARCGASFVNQIGLNIHYKKSHSVPMEKIKEEKSTEGPYCDKCDIRFLNKDAYDNHILHSAKHADEFPAESLKTPKRMKDTKLKFNMKTKQRRPTTCSLCGIYFDTMRAWIQHCQEEHPEFKYRERVVCEMCGKTVARVSLELHLRRHNNERPYSCEYCGMTFRSTTNRNRHLRTHTGERPFVCPRCSKSFTQDNSLKLHIRTVHLKQPYPKRDRRKRPKAPPDEQEQPIGSTIWEHSGIFNKICEES